MLRAAWPDLRDDGERERVKGLLPEKITLDAGIVVNKQVESGGSIEWNGAFTTEATGAHSGEALTVG